MFGDKSNFERRIDEVKNNLEKGDNPIIPNHYGGEDNQYEAIKVIDAWGANFRVGNALKYLRRYKEKGNPVQDIEKAIQYLILEKEKLQREL